MHMVLFEYQIAPGQALTYETTHDMLKDIVRGLDGFIDEITYQSLTRDDVYLSISTWRDERAIMRWRTQADHHDAQLKARRDLLTDYRVRVGQIVVDTTPPPGQPVIDQRLELSDVSTAPVQSLIDARRPPDFKWTSNPAQCAEQLGLNPYGSGLIDWELFEALGDTDCLLLWQGFADDVAAEAFETTSPGPPPAGGRLRRLRIMRDYSRTDRLDAPQIL